MRYVALLRGINVGGTGMVNMAELKTVFETAGMTGVKTYINSGNVKNRRHLTALLEEAIRQRFAFAVDLLLRDAGQMRSVVDAVPGHWKNDESMKCDVLFLWEDVDRPSVLDQLPRQPGLEDVLYVPGALVWRVDRENVSKSKMTKLVGTGLYKRMTVRNCNTVRKLLELMEGTEA
jgi:uncharacterized protein (DUF1697 family)